MEGKEQLEEIWRPVKGYEGLYLASSNGRIWSKPRWRSKGGILKPYVNRRNGYCYVHLTQNNVGKTVRVHRIIMTAFLGESSLQINHKDGDKTNNSLDNLEYCTGSQNMQHAYKNNLVSKTWSKKVINLTTGHVFDSASDAATNVGGKKANSVLRVCTGQRSAYRNNRFAFYDDYINGTIPEFKGKFTKKSSETLWV